jgi:hypothetical protein
VRLVFEIKEGILSGGKAQERITARTERDSDPGHAIRRAENVSDLRTRLQPLIAKWKFSRLKPGAITVAQAASLERCSDTNHF